MDRGFRWQKIVILFIEIFVRKSVPNIWIWRKGKRKLKYAKTISMLCKGLFCRKIWRGERFFDEKKWLGRDFFVRLLVLQFFVIGAFFLDRSRDPFLCASACAYCNETTPGFLTFVRRILSIARFLFNEFTIKSVMPYTRITCFWYRNWLPHDSAQIHGSRGWFYFSVKVFGNWTTVGKCGKLISPGHDVAALRKVDENNGVRFLM